MAIRIRIINGFTVALCAAKTGVKNGDLYLDDNIHHALTTKFGLDFFEEGLINESLGDKRLIDLIKLEESYK